MLRRDTVRLNKFISESGICSRREADRYIEAGSVTLNGRRAAVGDQVGPGDRVRVNGTEIAPREADQIIVIALNKPVGIVSTTEDAERDNVVRFVNHPARLFPIGRLDKDSQGLILLTNDGDLVNPILRAGNEHEKEYLVTVDRAITPEFIVAMSAGVPIMGTRTKKCVVERVTDHVFRIVLVQGLNRQIRRMCEHFGYEVTRLVRTRIMHITLKGLPEGDWRDLTDSELTELGRVLGDSQSEPPARATQNKPASRGDAAKGGASKVDASRGGASKGSGQNGSARTNRSDGSSPGRGRPPAKPASGGRGRQPGKPASGGRGRR